MRRASKKHQKFTVIVARSLLMVLYGKKLKSRRTKMNKVYVVVDEFYGTIADVNVYKNEPKNLKTISEDEGQRCFELEIKESNNE
jgi:hypothetical protein